MKTHFLFPALLAAGAAQAQTNALKVDIFQPINSTLALSFEHKLDASSSFQLGLSGTFNYREGGSSFGFSSSDSPVTSGFAITPEYRYYLSDRREALEGFYAAPYLRYQYLSQTGRYASSSTSYMQEYNASLNAFGLGLIVGRHWIFKQRFSLDIYAGPGYAVTGISSDRSDYSPKKGDFVGYVNDLNYDLRGGVTFGLAF